MTVPLNAYKYHELPPGAFRYLILNPGVREDPLTCSLHTSFIGETRYESVSYVWGTDQRDHNILCDGKILKITPNLYKVLQRVRLPDVPRNLWADSICINQENLQEKGRQVTIMGQIYRKADRVLICLGSVGEEHGPAALSLLHDVCEMIDIGVAEMNERVEVYKQGEGKDYDWDGWKPWGCFPYSDADAPVLSDQRWASLNILVEQEWFKRGWVVREAGLAQEGLVIWGHTEFSWSDLMRVLIWRHKRALTSILIPTEDCFRPHIEAYEARHQDTICVFYELGSWKACSLLEYIHFARILRLKDPRDRIYAFLDLADEPQSSFSMVPNYNDTSVKVYRDFAAHYICVTEDINILHYVKHDKRPSESDTMAWAPDWDKEGDTSAGYISLSDNYPPLMSRALETFAPKLIDGVTLEVKGVIIDSVKHVSKSLRAATTTLRDLFEIWHMVQASAEMPYSSSRHLEAYFDSLAMTSYYGDSSQWYDCRKAYMALFERLSSRTDQSDMTVWATDEVAELESSTFHRMIASMTSGKRIIITQRGYLGLAPDITQEGDSCGIIFGCSNPCLLSQTSLKDRYIYLGPGFILGKTLVDLGDDNMTYTCCLGVENSKDWLDWGVEEREMFLC